MLWIKSWQTGRVWGIGNKASFQKWGGLIKYGQRSLNVGSHITKSPKTTSLQAKKRRCKSSAAVCSNHEFMVIKPGLSMYMLRIPHKLYVTWKLSLLHLLQSAALTGKTDQLLSNCIILLWPYCACCSLGGRAQSSIVEILIMQMKTSEITWSGVLIRQKLFLSA